MRSSRLTESRTRSILRWAAMAKDLIYRGNSQLPRTNSQPLPNPNSQFANWSFWELAVWSWEWLGVGFWELGVTAEGRSHRAAARRLAIRTSPSHASRGTPSVQSAPPVPGAPPFQSL